MKKIHAENKCRKIMTPVSDFSPQIQHWYDSIHVYLALLHLKESDKKYSNSSNTYRFAKNCNIQNPKELTKEELRDSLRYCKIRRAEVRKSSKGLRKVLLRDCLIDARAKNQIGRARGIKQKIDQEYNIRMWYLIQKDSERPEQLCSS